MLSEGKLFYNSNDILFVLWISIVQLLNELGLDKTLLVKSFLISQYFYCNHGVELVIHALEDLAKGAFAESAENFKSVCQVLSFRGDIFIFVIVKPVIINAIGSQVIDVFVFSRLNV